MSREGTIYPATDARRWRLHKSDEVPTSPHVCPLCGSEMGWKVEGFGIFSAAYGPYAKISARLLCESETCRYQDIVRCSTKDPRKLAELYSILDAMRDATGAAAAGTDQDERAERTQHVRRRARK